VAVADPILLSSILYRNSANLFGMRQKYVRKSSMKMRWFFILATLFLLIGLLMPVGVYAQEGPGAMPTVEVVVDGDADTNAATTEDPCADEGEGNLTTTAAVTIDGEPTADGSTEDGSTGTNNQCPCSNGGIACVSWNS
jgi:hypothetical protein